MVIDYYCNGNVIVLLMEEILHHLGFKKIVDNGINYLSTGAGFLLSTVCFEQIALGKHVGFMDRDSL